MSNLEVYKNPAKHLAFKLKKIQDAEYESLRGIQRGLKLLNQKLLDEEKSKYIKPNEISRIIRDLSYILNTLENTKFLAKRLQVFAEQVEEETTPEGAIKKITKTIELKNPEIAQELIDDYNQLMVKINKKWHKE